MNDLRREVEKEAGMQAGHAGSYKEAGHMCDSYSCSCGWKSTGYFDGYEYAYDDWVKHLIQNGVELNYPEVTEELRFKG
ncbi:MAG: hypothetical protein AAB472_01140 [Patescibacteria group bacterium]